MKKENESKKSDGFSIVEMLIAVAIGLIVLAGLVVVFVSQKKAYDVQAQVTEMHQNARAALDMISRDVAGAGYDPTNYGVVGIPYDADRLQLRADLNGNGDTNDANEDVTYELAGTVINRTSGGNTVVFLENIENKDNLGFKIRYLKADGSEVNSSADEDKIRKIDIQLTVRTSRPDPSFADNNGYRTRTLRSEVNLRNMAENIASLPTVPPVTAIPVTTITETTSTETTSTETTSTETTSTETTSTDTTAAPDTTEPDTTATPTTLGPGGFDVTIIVAPNNKSAKVTAEVLSSVEIGSASLFYNVNGGVYSEVTMNFDSYDETTTTYTYSFTITGLTKGVIVNYYVEAYSADGQFMGSSAPDSFVAD